jgi:hypothetical protein
MKVGRNESCPCGSGKKYKVCCGAAPETESPQILAWRRLSRAIQDHVPKLLSFIAESHGPATIAEAWEEFTLWDEAPFDPESPQVTLFYPWLFHVWRPDPIETGVGARCLHSIPPTQAYLIARGKGMDQLVYRYLSACLDSPFGFFEILSCDPGHGMQMREILTETTCEVLERSASGSLTPGDIVYGMVVECDGISMLEASAPVALPIRLKTVIVDQREQLLEDEAWEREEVLNALAEEERAAEDAVSGDGLEHAGGEQTLNGDPAGATGDDATLHKSALMRYDFSNRELYWDLVLPLLNPAPPQMQNTDGDRLSMQRLIFAVDSTAAAFQALKGLAVGQSEEELLQDAEYAADKGLRRIAFNWTKRGNSRHKGWETTIVGRIDIEGTRLAAEVNSAERAAEFKRLVSERLGEKARYRVTEIQSMERLLAEARAKPPHADTQADRDQAALMARPEVQAHLRGMMARHYEEWVDEKLPALRGKTPREAVRTAAGREKVEALIREIERMGPGMGGYEPSITDSLRERLGL